MQPQDWLNQFLDQKQKDGRPLYRYDLSDAEFATLGEALEISTAAIKNSPGWNAVFVFYAAAWWRRNYAGGAFSWEGLFASFDVNATELDSNQWNLIVESGLKFWQRPIRVIHDRSSYLGTIAYEGGVSLQQLHSIEHCLRELLIVAIPQYLRLQNASMLDAMRIIDAYLIDKPIPGYEPDHIIYTQLADMVYVVAQLKTAFQLSNRTNPVEVLNQFIPDWQQMFPLPPNEAIARSLLTDLINVAAQVNSQPAPFRGRRVLNIVPHPHLSLEFEFAALIDLNALFGNERVVNFPDRVTLDIVSGDGDCTYLGMALKTTVNQKDVLKMPCCSISPLQARFTEAYKLRFRHLTHTLFEVPLIIAIDDDVPWTFAPDNHDWLLVGTTSISTPDEQVCILYAKNLSCNATQMTELANLDDKKLIKARGSIELFDDTDQRYRIQTAQNQVMPLFYLQAKTLPFSSIPKDVYLGTPSFWSFDSQTVSAQPNNMPLLAKAINSKSSPKTLSNQQGLYQLRVQDEHGNTRFCQTCALLPENFTLRFFHGRIEIDHSERAYISCDSPWLTQITATEKGRSIEFNIDETAPDYVELILRWFKSDRLSLRLPFPIRSARLIDGSGNKLKQLTIDQLPGVNLRLLGEHEQHKHGVSLRFCLKAPNLNDSEVYFRDEVSKTGTVLELALRDYQCWINELLTVSGYPDSYVRLTVYEQGEEILRANIVRAPQARLERKQLVHSIDEINRLSDTVSLRNDSLRLLFTRHRLKHLCLDFSAHDWQYLQQLQSDQPLADNEIWTAACLDNEVLVALVCQLDCALMQRFTMELFVCWELIAISDWLVIFTRYKNYLALIMTEADVITLLNSRIDKLTQLAPALNMIGQILKVQLCKAGNGELLLMPVVKEQLAQQQQQLTQRHADSRWPGFLQTELKHLWQKLPSATQDLLNLKNVDRADSVLRLPVLLAHFTLTALPSSWRQSTDVAFKLRQLKAFDEHWFTNAFTLSLGYLSQQTDYIQSLQQETETMINSDENDLIAEIEQQLALTTREIQDLESDVSTYKSNQKELEMLQAENDNLTSTVEQMGEMINKRDVALKLLLAEVTRLNGQIRTIRNELQTKL